MPSNHIGPMSARKAKRVSPPLRMTPTIITRLPAFSQSVIAMAPNTPNASIRASGDMRYRDINTPRVIRMTSPITTPPPTLRNMKRRA